MRRKLLASIITITVVLSLFVGIDVAAAATHKIMLNTTTVITGGPQSVGFAEVQGSIVLQNHAYDGRDFQVQVSYEGGSIPAGTYEAQGGTFRFYLPTNLQPQDVYLYARAYDAKGRLGGIVATATIKVRYNVKTDPADLNFSYADYGAGAYVIGTVTNRDGKPVQGVEVALKQGYKNYAPSTLTNVNGEFGILIPRWENIGPVELYVDGFLHKTGKVGGIPANLSVTPSNNVVHSIAETTFTIQGSGFSPYNSVSFSLTKNSDPVGVYISSVAATSSGTVTQTFRWTPLSTGTYTLEASQGYYSASTKITVVNPSGYNFVNTDQLTKLRVGDASRNQLRIGKPNGTYLVTWDGNRLYDNFHYDVYVDGKLRVEKQANALFGVEATQLGSKMIRVVAFRDARPSGTYYPVWERVYEQTFVGTVSGWNVSIRPGTLTVNEASDIVFVIKDEKGTPINNATIKFDRYEYNPYNYNSQNGTYIFRDVKFSTAGAVPVVVKQGDEEKASHTLNVVGQKVYQITSDTTTLLQGQAQKVRFHVGKSGQPLMPQSLEMQDKDGKITPLQFSLVTTSGNHSTIDASITPAATGDVVIRARNFTGTECGEVKLKVVAPKLVLIDTQAANLTENIKTTVRFKVVDPRDGSPIKSNIQLVADYAAITVRDAYDGLLMNNTLFGAAEHTVSILATDVQSEAASEKKEDVAVYLQMNGATVSGSFPIKPATLESEPPMVIIGAPTSLTLTYKDANEKPIANKMVQVQEGSGFVNYERTDAQGRVIYPAIHSYGASTVFRAATDVDKQFVKTEVRAGYDNEKPQVSYKKESKTATATLLITDNVRLTRIRINGEDIDFFASKRYEHTLQLKSGINRFRVQVQDGNYNTYDETIEIKYTASGDAPITYGQVVKYTLNQKTYYVDGVPRQLEAAPFLRGNHTLVPVRALQSIGAVFAWDTPTRTATFQLDGNVVKVTIGKATAVVNGKATVMPIAAEIVNDRTMIPFRFVGQSLGLRVDYIDATKEIIIKR